MHLKVKVQFMHLLNKIVKQDTAISNATIFCIRIGQNQTYALFRTCEKNHTIVHQHHMF